MLISDGIVEGTSLSFTFDDSYVDVEDGSNSLLEVDLELSDSDNGSDLDVNTSKGFTKFFGSSNKSFESVFECEADNKLLGLLVDFLLLEELDDEFCEFEEEDLCEALGSCWWGMDFSDMFFGFAFLSWSDIDSKDDSESDADLWCWVLRFNSFVLGGLE